MKTTSKIPNFNLNSKQGRLFKALVLEKESLTPVEISRRFKIRNPRAAVSNIRDHGYAIYTNPRKISNGETVTEYRYGEASREMVVLAYKARRYGMTV